MPAARTSAGKQRASLSLSEYSGLSMPRCGRMPHSEAKRECIVFGSEAWRVENMGSHSLRNAVGRVPRGACWVGAWGGGGSSLRIAYVESLE